MAIQPIDLQTMYSQMANIAQNAAQAQDGGRLTEAMQQQNIVRQNLEAVAFPGLHPTKREPNRAP